MLKVLIADDEFRIAQLINKLIHWNELQIELVGIAENGLQAYDMIVELSPDIVITDIRMPLLDGLELIHKSKENSSECKFIVISGYKQFEYAKSALEYGVVNYLLKPIKEAEVNKTLYKVIEDINKEQNRIDREMQLKESVEKSRRIVDVDFINHLQNEQDCLKDIKELNADYQMDMQQANYRAIAFMVDYKNFDNINYQQDDFVRKTVVSLIEDTLDPLVIEHAIASKNNMLIQCVLNYETIKSKALSEAINMLLFKIQEYLFGLEKYEITISIGTEESQWMNIRHSLKTANEGIRNRILLGTDRLIEIEYYQQAGEEFQDIISAYDPEKLINIVESMSENLLIEMIYNVMLEIRNSPSGIVFNGYEIANRFAEAFFEALQNAGFNNLEMKKKVLELIPHCYTFVALEELLQANMVDGLRYLKAIKENEASKPIREALKYMEANFNKKITLKEVADLVGLNSTYFSVVFKKEMNKNFSTYLSELRIIKAKKLLITTNDTIENIANRVGYNDVRRFSKYFLKSVGIRPAFYRKLYS